MLKEKKPGKIKATAYTWKSIEGLKLNSLLLTGLDRKIHTIQDFSAWNVFFSHLYSWLEIIAFCFE